MAALIHKCGEKKYPFAEFRNFIAGRRTQSSQKESDINGTSLSSSDDETPPKHKKSFGANINANFNAFMVRRCEDIIEADNVLFKNRKIFPISPITGFKIGQIISSTD